MSGVRALLALSLLGALLITLVRGAYRGVLAIGRAPTKRDATVECVASFASLVLVSAVVVGLVAVIAP